MRVLIQHITNEDGVVLGITILVLAIFTILGATAISFTTTEMQRATNDRFHKIAFYGAEAARGFVSKSTDLYGIENITADEGLNFPNNDEASSKQSLDPYQSFNGKVTYLGSSTPPRGSGFEVGLFKAHRYNMACNGYGPRKTKSRLETGF